MKSARCLSICATGIVYSCDACGSSDYEKHAGETRTFCTGYQKIVGDSGAYGMVCTFAVRCQ